MKPFRILHLFACLAAPLQATVFGPDTYGYTLDDVQAHEWIEISATGQLVVGAGNDISSNHPTSGIGKPVKLGHPFTLYGTTYHELVPTSNGYLSGDPAETGADATNDCPFPATPSQGGGARILAFHDDLAIAPTGGSGVFYQYFDISPHSLARCGMSVFTWKNVTFAGGTTPFSFQVLLFDSGDIIVNYDNAGLVLGASATAGIMHSDFRTGLSWFCNAITINSDRAILYEPPSLTVGSTSDENRPNPPANAISLREAIRDIPAGGKIYFPPASTGFPFSYVANLVVDRPMSFIGDFPDSPSLFFSTPHLIGISFTVQGGAVLNLDNMPLNDSTGATITARGNAHVKLVNCGIVGAKGSAINVSAGARVTLARTVIDAPGAVNADGVVVNGTGTFRMYESLIDGCRGAGIAVKTDGTRLERPAVELYHSSIIRNWSGGIRGDGEHLIIASTISDNAGPGFSMVGNAALTVRQSSIMDNRPGVVLDGGSTAHFTRTVLSRNPGLGTNAASDLVISSGSAVSGGWNLVGNTHGVFTVGSDIIAADPHFTPVGPYAANFPARRIGPRRGFNHLYCHMPLAASPAIDGAGTPGALGFPHDIRGLSRVANGDNTGGATLDIGPVEIAGFVTVTTAVDENNGVGSGAGASLRELNFTPDSLAVIRFAPGLDGQTILATQTQALGNNRFVDASMLPNGIKIDGTNLGQQTLASGTFWHGVTFQFGDYKAFNKETPLIISNCHFIGNKAGRGRIPARLNAGGAIQSNDLLHATNCTFTGNTATDANPGASGGAIHVETVITPQSTNETRGFGYLIGCRFVGNTANVSGGAVYFPPASRRAWIDRCEFIGNNVGGNAAAILILGGGNTYSTRAAVLRSSFSDNTASEISSIGALGLAPSVGITFPVWNCTFDRNSASGRGGAIGLLQNGGDVEISHCTITRNYGELGGGALFVEGGTMTLSNSIIDDSTAHDGVLAPPESERVISVQRDGVFQSLGNNFAGESVPLLSSSTDITRIDPMLNELLNHGGPTSSRHPNAGSRVIDSGPAVAAFPTDQRGLPARSGARTDRGAVEAFQLIVNTSADELNTPAGVNRSLREALRDAIPGTHVIFNDNAMASRTIDLATGMNTQLGVSKTLFIDATDTSHGITVSGPTGARCVDIAKGGNTVQFHGVSFTNGRPSSTGGAIRKGIGAELVISRSAIYENTAFSGAGVQLLSGRAQFTNVTFSSNIATTGGGGAILAQAGAVVEMAHCTLVGNASTTGGATVDLDGNASLSTRLSAFAERASTASSIPSFHLEAGASVVSLGRNLFHDGPQPWSVGTDLSGASGLGSALEDAGGLAPIYFVNVSSVMLDAVIASAARAPTDARGFPRVYGPGLEIGAAEMNAVDYGLDVDTDMDGMPDAWELEHGFNINNANDATDDEDGDGQNNLSEFIAQTNPESSASVFKTISFVRDPDESLVTIVWSSVPGLQYSVWSSPSLEPTDWVLHSTVTATGPTHTQFIVGPVSVPPGKHFYRVQIER